jgi:hypothetical protein
MKKFTKRNRKAVARKQAFADISKYLRESGQYLDPLQDVQWQSWTVTPSWLDNAYTHALNKQLGL